MYELADLYQQLILDHNKSPRNRRRLEEPCRRALGYNPLCGDRVTVYLQVEDGAVRDIAFEGTGCAISIAAASMMTQRLKGKSVAEATELFRKFHDLVTVGDGGAAGASGDGLGKLEAFAGVRRFPARVKCATLVWHTMAAALKNTAELVTTE